MYPLLVEKKIFTAIWEWNLPSQLYDKQRKIKIKIIKGLNWTTTLLKLLLNSLNLVPLWKKMKNKANNYIYMQQ